MVIAEGGGAGSGTTAAVAFAENSLTVDVATNGSAAPSPLRG